LEAIILGELAFVRLFFLSSLAPEMGEWLLSRRDRLIVAKHEVPLQFGHFKTVKPDEILGFCQVKVFVFLLASEFCLV
jgi:hypothetical protein